MVEIFLEYKGIRGGVLNNMATKKSYEYGTRIIAFIDILGFKNYIFESDTDKEKAKNVFALVSDLKEKIKSDYESDDRVVCKGKPGL